MPSTVQMKVPMISADFVRDLVPMEATVERRGPGSINDWGHPTEGDLTVHVIPCFAQEMAEREPINENVTAVIEDIRMVCPMDSDVTEMDQITNIRGRDDGPVYYLGPLLVDAVMPRPMGWFKTLVLRRVTP